MTRAQTALDRWARSFGYSDYDTYIRAGGSVAETARDITRRIGRLKAALNALQFGPEDEPPDAEPMAKTSPPEPPSNFHAGSVAEPDEPPDPDNAHIQGAEHDEP